MPPDKTPPESFSVPSFGESLSITLVGNTLGNMAREAAGLGMAVQDLIAQKLRRSLTSTAYAAAQRPSLN